MFFRREKVKVLSFAGHLDALRAAGFTVQEPGSGKSVAIRGGCAAVIEEGPHLAGLGWLVGNEIAELVDAGYQKYWRTPSEVRQPARADQLQQLHAFEEDLREELGLTSLYNESLGTVNASHMYDRIVDRDRGVPRRPWNGR